MHITELLDWLDTFEHAAPLPELVSRLEALNITVDDLGPAVCYSDEGYKRNLLREGRAYQALALCWKAGQKSPIHDHRGSACGVRVVSGTVTEQVFERKGDGTLTAGRSTTLTAPQVCGSFDADIHELINPATDGAGLVTIHVYSPPLQEFGVYSRNNAGIVDWNAPVCGAPTF